VRIWVRVVVRNDGLGVEGTSGSAPAASPDGGFAVVWPFRNSVAAAGLEVLLKKAVEGQPIRGPAPGRSRRCR
jgi:hypothetical protein